jgi:hypothetical protein
VNPRPKHPLAETVPMVIMVRRELRNALLAHCRESGDIADDVVSDAVMLHIDAGQGEVGADEIAAVLQ